MKHGAVLLGPFIHLSERAHSTLVDFFLGSVDGPPSSFIHRLLHLHPHSTATPQPLPTTQSTRRLVAVRAGATTTRGAGGSHQAHAHARAHGASRLGGHRSRYPGAALSPHFVRHGPLLVASRWGLQRLPGSVPPQPARPGYAGAARRWLPRGARGGPAGQRIRRGRPRRRGGHAEEVRRHRGAHQLHGARGLRALRRRLARTHRRAPGSCSLRGIPGFPSPRTYPNITGTRMLSVQCVERRI